MIYIRLALEFLKIGLFAIGGGLASIPFLYDIAARTGWFTGSDIINMIAISESTPGPLGINMATYVGYTVAGPAGGVIATLCTIAPSVALLIVIAGLLQRFMKNRFVKAAFYGLRPAVTALIAAAFWQVARAALLNPQALQEGGSPGQLIKAGPFALALILYLLIRRYKKHPAVYIALAAAAGVVLKM